MQQGFSRAEALEMDPTERRAIVLAVGLQNGMKIDWADGSLVVPESP